MPLGSNAPRGLLGDFPLGRPRADAHAGRSVSRLTEPRGHARPGSTVRVPDGACGLQQGTRPSQRGAAAARGWLARTCAVPSSRGLRGCWAPGQPRPSARRSPGATSPPAPRAARRWRLRRKPLHEGQTLRRHLPAGAPRGPRWRWGLPESRPTLASACPLPRAPRCLPGTLSPAFALGPLLGASNPGWPGRTEGPRVSPLEARAGAGRPRGAGPRAKPAAFGRWAPGRGAIDRRVDRAGHRPFSRVVLEKGRNARWGRSVRQSGKTTRSKLQNELR